MKTIIAGAALMAIAGMAMPAQAADNIMKVCGAKYQAAKANKTLPAGQTWNQYLAQCRGSGAATAPAATPVAATKPVPVAPVAAPAAAKPSIFSRMTTKPATPAPAPVAPVAAKPVVASASPASHLPSAQSPAMQAMHDRQRQCGAQWKTDKAAGKTGTQTWPQYWSACNKRLKG